MNLLKRVGLFHCHSSLLRHITERDRGGGGEREIERGEEKAGKRKRKGERESGGNGRKSMHNREVVCM